jgi:hypothetical protein
VALAVFGRELRFAAVDDNALNTTLTGTLDVWTFRLGEHTHRPPSMDSDSTRDHHSLSETLVTPEMARALATAAASFGADPGRSAWTESTDALDGWFLPTADLSRQDDFWIWRS